MAEDPVSAKDAEEFRLLTAFFHRLALTPTTVEKAECPDFFVRFVDETRTVVVGCELVRFHSDLSNASRIEHLHRWRQFGVRLKTALEESGLGTRCGAVHPKEDDRAAFDALTLRRTEAAAIAEIVRLARRTDGTTDQRFSDFDGAEFPILAAHVDHIFLQHQPWDARNDLWWWAPMQAGSIEEPLPVLETIMQGKEAKARQWNWRNADERWLVVVGEAKALGDSMPLPEDTVISIAPAPAFTRVFAWDGFLERVVELLPSGRIVFEVAHSKENLVHMGPFPPLLKPFCKVRT